MTRLQTSFSLSRTCEPEDWGDAYVETLQRLRELAVSIVHGGHLPSFGPTRLLQIIDEYCSGARRPGCHLAGLA